MTRHQVNFHGVWRRYVNVWSEHDQSTRVRTSSSIVKEAFELRFICETHFLRMFPARHRPSNSLDTCICAIESVCMCVCERERERKRESVCVRERERERESVCVFVCV